MNKQNLLYVFLLVSLVLVAGCKSTQSVSAIYSKDLPTLKIKNGAAQIKQRLEVTRDDKQSGFGYRARIILTVSPRVADEVDDVYLASTVPVVFAKNSNDLTLSKAPTLLLEEKPAFLFRFDPLKEPTEITIVSDQDNLGTLALRYNPDGTYRFSNEILPRELKYIPESDQSLIDQIGLYAYDRQPGVKEKRAAINYFKDHEATLNQVRKATDELYVIYSTSFDALIKDSIDTLDGTTARQLSTYTDEDFYLENKDAITRAIGASIPDEVVKKSGLSRDKLVADLTSRSVDILLAREEMAAQAKTPKPKKVPETAKPAIVMTEKGDTNNDGKAEKLHVYRLPDGTYRIEIVSSDNNVLFSSNAFADMPKSVEIKSEEGSPYPVYVVVFTQASGQGAFIGFNGQDYDFLTQESF